MWDVASLWGARKSASGRGPIRWTQGGWSERRLRVELGSEDLWHRSHCTCMMMGPGAWGGAGTYVNTLLARMVARDFIGRAAPGRHERRGWIGRLKRMIVARLFVFVFEMRRKSDGYCPTLVRRHVKRHAPSRFRPRRRAAARTRPPQRAPAAARASRRPTAAPEAVSPSKTAQSAPWRATGPGDGRHGRAGVEAYRNARPSTRRRNSL